ncbi:autotransporter outer membrane beta-barrel domain-containing protein [Helicobacter winghamensis]|uniref:autotransporter outer membrane beta-barrel domain-containing protein n=1 Tax=Helicobacter winghamensis TaxID=157268 RepID=UPI0027A1A181
MIFLRGAFKRYLAPFTSKAIYYSVLATSLSTFIFHSPAYAESFSNNESSIPQIVALNVTQNPLVNPAQNLKNSKVKLDSNLKTNRNNTGQLRTFSSVKATENKLEIDNNTQNITYTGETKLDELNFNIGGLHESKIEKKVTFDKLTIDRLTTAQAGIPGLDPNKSKEERKQIIESWINNLQPNQYGQYPSIDKFAQLSLEGESLTINNNIDNQGDVNIKTKHLDIAGDVAINYGYLSIEFDEGSLGRINAGNRTKIEFGKTDVFFDNSPSFSIITKKGEIVSDVISKNGGSLSIWIGDEKNGGGKMTGDIIFEGYKDSDRWVIYNKFVNVDSAKPYLKEYGEWVGSYYGIGSFLNLMTLGALNGSSIEGNIDLKGDVSSWIMLHKNALMSGDLKVATTGSHKRSYFGYPILYFTGDSEISGDITVEKNATLQMTTSRVNPMMPLFAGLGSKNLVSGKITNKGEMRLDSVRGSNFTIQQTIDNIGGVLGIYDDVENSFAGTTFKFLRGDSGTDAHFKNTNGGKIAINRWDFREDEGNGRIIIDTDGQNKREENLKNVKFGEFQHWNSSFIPPTADNPVILFGDDKIFAKGSYVQYLVLTPEEEKDLKDGKISIYDKDGRHNVAGHFIEGGAGANGESNFATLLSEGKVIKLSVGGGDTIAPVVQADGLIGELKVNDDTPGSTIGSNQINALNTNMTQTFNTIKEISTKTFRTEHTNHLSSNTLKEQVAYALYNHSKNVSKNNSLDNNPINKNLSSNNLKNHTNNNLLSYNAKNNSLNDNINLLDNTSNPGNTNIASNVSNINALTNPASNTSENNTLSNASNNTNLEAYITDEQITTYATYAQAGASDALFYDEINKGYTDLDLLRALDDIFIKQNKKESDLYTYAVPYYNYIKDKSLGLGTTKTNSYGLLAGGQLNSNYGVYGFYINLENSKRENNTTSTDTDSTSYLAGLTYYNAFHRFSNKELYVSLNTMLGTTKSDVSMIDSDSYKDDFDFDSLNYGAELRAGVNIYNVLTNSYWTPELGLIYTGMAVDSYEIKHTKLTEYYDKTTINLLEGVAGLRFHHAYNQTTRFNAALGAKFRLYDDAKSQMKIAGETLANPLFATRDIKLPDTSYYVQFGLVKLLGDNVELSLNYQGNFAKDIQGHTAFARIGYWW